VGLGIDPYSPLPPATTATAVVLRWVAYVEGATQLFLPLPGRGVFYTSLHVGSVVKFHDFANCRAVIAQSV
jgi:hypothetical protein